MGRVYEAALRDSDRMHLRTSELADAVGGRLEGPDVTVDGASQDSRAIRRGQLFVPVVAERDGHEFIGAALANGRGRLPHRRAGSRAAPRSSSTTPSRALQAAGRFARTRLPSPVFGITGSVGKTSVKDLLASILSERLVTAASAQSFNNELGVPLTLLNAPDGTQAVVVEMGARGVGHIAELCAIARPTVGIVTRVARRAHLGVRHHRRRGAGQGRAGRGAAGPRASPSSTPPIRAWRPWRRAPRRP